MIKQNLTQGKNKGQKGITLVALIITIIVLVILATVSLQAINGEGIIGRAQEAAFKAELANLQEELELYKTGKIIKTSGKFEPTSLSANKLWLFYEPEKYIENGTIEEVMPNISEKMKNKIEVLNGEILFSGTEKEIRWAKEIGINKTVKIENGVLLSDNDNLSILSEDGTFTVPSTVTTVGEGAFSLLGDKIKKVIIPYTVNEIAQNAFYGNTSIEEVEFQTREVNNELKGATKIGKSSFQGCTALKKATLPDSLTEISSEAFRGCSELTEVIFPKKLNRIGNWAFDACKSLQSVNLPDGLGWMEAYAFRDCVSLREVIIPSSTKNIGLASFGGCSNLRKVEFLSDNCGLYGGVFDGCVNLEDLKLPKKLTTLRNLFSNCKKITEISIPETVTSIATGAFGGLPNLENIIFEGNNPYFEFKESALLNKKDSETTIIYILPKALTVDTFKIPNGVTKVEGNIFGNNVKKLEISASVTNIGVDIFDSGITDITIDGDNPNYSAYSGGLYNKGQTELIYYFKNEQTVNLASTLITIKSDSLRGKNITTINLPDSLTTIESSGITCPNVTTIKIGKNVSSIEGKSALSGGIKTIEIDANNPNYTFEDGGLYNKNKTNLIGVYSLKAENGGQTFTIASTVKTIGDSAFAKTDITKIEIPNSVEEIGNSGFKGCNKLKEIIIPSSIKVWGTSAFESCSSIQTVIFSIGVKTIGDSCFKNCSNLKEINIPSSVDSIGGYCFSYCSNLKEINIPSSVNSIGASCFDGCLNLDAINIDKTRNSINGAPWGAVKGERIINWK